MTSQEIFDTVLFNLRRQGRPSLSVSGGCAYRGHNGAKCAVGWLIPDDKYSPSFEGYGVRGAINEVQLGYPHRLGEVLTELGLAPHAELLTGLQVAHDGPLVNDLGDWEDAMQRVARQFGLTYTPPVNGDNSGD